MLYLIKGIVHGLKIPEAYFWTKYYVKRLFGWKPKYTLEQINEMTGKEFEHCVQDILESKGYYCKTLPWNDYGADLIAEKDLLTIVIQCKRYSENVGLSAIQECFTAVKYYNADKGWVITNSNFTKPAETIAEKCGIRTINNNELKKIII